MKRTLLAFAAITAISLTAAAPKLSAQMLLTQSFTGNSLPSGFTTATGTTTNIGFSSAGADFNGGSAGTRDYIRTSGTAYNTINFSATINLINNSANGGAFVGFGTGGQGTFQEPDSNGAIYLRLTQNNAQVLPGGPFGSVSYQFNNPNQGDALTLGFTYTTATNSINFILTDQTTSTTQMSGPIALSSSFNTTDSSVFFGGEGNGTSDPVYTNLSIVGVPEPSTWVMMPSLCVVVAMVLAVRRRTGASVL